MTNFECKLFTFFLFQPSIKSKGSSVQKTETVSSGWGDDEWGANDDWGSSAEPAAGNTGANNDWGVTTESSGGDNWGGDNWGAADSWSTQPTKTSE